MKYVLTLILVGALGLGAATAHADVLTLRGGETLSGSLVDIRGGMLSFRTKLAGKVYYPLDEVAGVSTTNFVAVAMIDDRLLHGRLRTREGVTVIEGGDGSYSQPIALNEIRGIDALPASASTPEGSGDGGSGLDVSVDIGYRWRSGALDYHGPFARVEVGHESETTEARVRLDIEYVGDSGSFNRFFSADGRVQLGDPEGWRPEIGLEFERNRDQALDLRSNLTLGMNRRLIDTDQERFDVTAGIGVAVEQYDSEDLRRDQGRRIRHFLREGKVDDEEIHARLSLRYTRQLFRDTYFETDLDLRPSITDFGDLRAQLESALFVPITPRMRLRMDWVVDYDDDPKFRGIEEWRTSVGASIQVDF